MLLTELRGKQANLNRWEALKLLDFIKDAEIIECIFKIKNPAFFSSKTPEQIIEAVKESNRIDKVIKVIMEGGKVNEVQK